MSHITNKYLESIIYIRNKDNNNVLNYKKIDIQPCIAKYSNTKEPIYKMILDDTPISRNNNLIIGYQCITCMQKQEITLNIFIRKVNKKGERCSACVNLEEEKCKNHSGFMRGIAQTGNIEKSEKIKVKSLPFNDCVNLSATEWNAESDDFKNAYFIKHLTIDEFENRRSAIKGINNKKITDISDWVYMPNYRIWNQTRYTPMLLNYKTQSIEKPLYISFSCENCENEFIHRDIEIIKNKLKLLCNSCTLCNKTFRIRSMKVNDVKVLWQSVPERRFIEWCVSNNVQIKNGPKIEYNVNNKNHIYKVDFELPELNLLVEIKDNHHWYKKHIANGVQEAKEVCANEWCEQNGYEYHIIFPKTLSAIKEYILNKSCKI
jgi:hypothetical protein